MHSDLVSETMAYLAILADKTASTERVRACRARLRGYMIDTGNTPEQADYWIEYSVAVSEDEFLLEALETDAAIGVIAGWIVS